MGKYWIEVCIGIVLIIITAPVLFMAKEIVQICKQDDYIKQLEQNNFEQIEEKEYYITRTQELENILLDSGIVVDECECE